MKKKTSKAVIMLAVIVLGLCGVLTGCDGCGGGESKAVTLTELIRENYARDMEAKHDAEGREHMEIPEGAETVTVEGIEYTVVRDLQEIYDNSGNYILANDVEWRRLGPQDNKFTGRFHGNNYKVYGHRGGHALFGYTKNAVIQNILISSNTIQDTNPQEALLVDWLCNSVIQDCVNYCQPSPENNQHLSWPMIAWAESSEVSGLVNFADFYSRGGGVVARAEDSKISDCFNYGNIFSDKEWGVGGIVGNIIGAATIEDCLNYGSILGDCLMGGIIGKIKQTNQNEVIIDLSKAEDFLDTQIIRNCKNYGDIYLVRKEWDTRPESVNHELNANIYCIGGIAGNASIIENCVNEGNFYGFESLGKKLYVEFMGGIAGAAKKATDCENKGAWNIHKGRAKHVGDLLGYTIG